MVRTNYSAGFRHLCTSRCKFLLFTGSSLQCARIPLYKKLVFLPMRKLLTGRLINPTARTPNDVQTDRNTHDEGHDEPSAIGATAFEGWRDAEMAPLAW